MFYSHLAIATDKLVLLKYVCKSVQDFEFYLHSMDQLYALKYDCLLFQWILTIDNSNNSKYNWLNLKFYIRQSRSS